MVCQHCSGCLCNRACYDSLCFPFDDPEEDIKLVLGGYSYVVLHLALKLLEPKHEQFRGPVPSKEWKKSLNEVPSLPNLILIFSAVSGHEGRKGRNKKPLLRRVGAGRFGFAEALIFIVVSLPESNVGV